VSKAGGLFEGQEPAPRRSLKGDDKDGAVCEVCNGCWHFIGRMTAGQWANAASLIENKPSSMFLRCTPEQHAFIDKFKAGYVRLDGKEIVEVKGSSKNIKGAVYPPPPKGMAPAVCVDVIDLGLIEIDGTKFGKGKSLQHMGQLVFQIEARREDKKRFELRTKRFNVDMLQSERSTIRKILDPWLGEPTQQEKEEFDYEKLIGKGAILNIGHRDAQDGRVFGNIIAVSPLMPGMKVLEPENYVRVKDRVSADSASDNDDEVPF